MTRAIAALLDIMTDTAAPVRRRVEACEGLLAYEAPEEAVEKAKDFLASIFEDANQHIDDRLDALKLMRKAEARRISQPTVTAADDRANRETWRRLEAARRRMALIEAGMWPPPKGWADDLMSENYKAPPGSLISVSTMAEDVRRGRLRGDARARKPG